MCKCPTSLSGRYVVGLWSVCGRLVVGMWLVCGWYVVGLWSVCGRLVVGMWLVCGRYVVGVWSVCGRLVVGMWLVCGRHVVGVWSVCGWLVVGMWSVCGRFDCGSNPNPGSFWVVGKSSTDHILISSTCPRLPTTSLLTLLQRTMRPSHRIPNLVIKHYRHVIVIITAIVIIFLVVDLFITVVLIISAPPNVAILYCRYVVVIMSSSPSSSSSWHRHQHCHGHHRHRRCHHYHHCCWNHIDSTSTHISAYITYTNLAVRRIIEAMHTAYAKSGTRFQHVSNYTWGKRSRKAREYCERKARIICEHFMSLNRLMNPMEKVISKGVIRFSISFRWYAFPNFCT